MGKRGEMLRVCFGVLEDLGREALNVHREGQTGTILPKCSCAVVGWKPGNMGSGVCH